MVPSKTDSDSRNFGPAPPSQHVSQSSCPVERFEGRPFETTRSVVIQSYSGKDKSIPCMELCGAGHFSTARDSSSELFRATMQSHSSAGTLESGHCPAEQGR